jgi:hypothetical protein
MMMQPAGVKHSPNHHHVVLMNWARCKGLDLGREGYEGIALFVGVRDGLHAFVVEGRGPGTHPVHCTYPYLNGGRWRRSQHSRTRAFAMALDLFLRLTDQASPRASQHLRSTR